jgi:hypothetical protein
MTTHASNKQSSTEAARATPSEVSGRELLRHTLATLAYRAAKAMRGAPPEFAAFRVSPTSRTPSQIVSHMCDLMEWACWLAQGEHRWTDSAPGEWADDVARFFDGLQRLDSYVASGAPLLRSAEQLFQGPVADALTHVGQLTMLRRASGSPVRGESYARADIVRGRVGPEQAAARVEFD